LSSSKVLALLDCIWEGEGTNECDGSLYDFSLITYLAGSDVVYIPGKPFSFKEVLTNNFQAETKDKGFWFQYKFRHKSVAYSYLKELI
jgi:hypothetical protein